MMFCILGGGGEGSPGFAITKMRDAVSQIQMSERHNVRSSNYKTKAAANQVKFFTCLLISAPLYLDSVNSNSLLRRYCPPEDKAFVFNLILGIPCTSEVDL